MAKSSLEERVIALEREVAELKVSSKNGTSGKNWRRTIGMFTDDPEMQRLFEEAMKLREADRARARRTPSRSRRAKA